MPYLECVLVCPHSVVLLLHSSPSPTLPFLHPQNTWKPGGNPALMAPCWPILTLISVLANLSSKSKFLSSSDVAVQRSGAAFNRKFLLPLVVTGEHPLYGLWPVDVFEYAPETGTSGLGNVDRPDIPHINFGSVFLRPPCDE